MLSCPRFGGVRWDPSMACFGRPKNSLSHLPLKLKQFGTLFLRYAKNYHQPTPIALGQSKYVWKMHSLVGLGTERIAWRMLQNAG